MTFKLYTLMTCEIFWALSQKDTLAGCFKVEQFGCHIERESQAVNPWKRGACIKNNPGRIYLVVTIFLLLAQGSQLLKLESNKLFRINRASTSWLKSLREFLYHSGQTNIQ